MNAKAQAMKAIMLMFCDTETDIKNVNQLTEEQLTATALVVELQTKGNIIEAAKNLQTPEGRQKARTEFEAMLMGDKKDSHDVLTILMENLETCKAEGYPLIAGIIEAIVGHESPYSKVNLSLTLFELLTQTLSLLNHERLLSVEYKQRLIAHSAQLAQCLLQHGSNTESQDTTMVVYRAKEDLIGKKFKDKLN